MSVTSHSNRDKAAAITIIQAFQATVKAHGNKSALKHKATHADDFSSISWSEYYKTCFDFAKSLVSMKFKVGASVNVLGYNSPEWFISHLGCICAGGMSAGIYTTNLPDACAYIISHSEAEVICVDGEEQRLKIEQTISQTPNLKAIVQWGDLSNAPKSGTTYGAGGHCKFYTWKEFLALGSSVKGSQVEERINNQKPDECASLIYTSGTTGPPKAVMISHDNAVWTSNTADECMGGLFPTDRLISYLPLSHIAAQLLDIFVPLLSGAVVYFALPDALKGTLAIQLQAIRPTIFFGVPRVWEKIYEKMMSV
jgi:long-chain-fatty-acid--CoA ligase ACSBG